jgi:hypothetical protein
MYREIEKKTAACFWLELSHKKNWEKNHPQKSTVQLRQKSFYKTQMDRVKTYCFISSKRFDVIQKLNAKSKLRGGNLRIKNAETNYAATR